MKTITELRENLLREIERNDLDKTEWCLQALDSYIDARIAAALAMKSHSFILKAEPSQFLFKPIDPTGLCEKHAPPVMFHRCVNCGKEHFNCCGQCKEGTAKP